MQIFIAINNEDQNSLTLRGGKFIEEKEEITKESI